MNEQTVGREPVELIEIIVPKCANVHGSAPCAAVQTGSAKCFNTRATCNDANNFQARPLSHLAADLILTRAETGSQTENGEDAYFIEIDLRIPSEPSGVIFEIGGATDNLYVGIDGSGDLVARCGDATVADGADVARMTASLAAYLGGSFKLIIRATRDAGVSQTIEAWLFDPVELELYALGSDTAAGDSGAIFGSGDFGVGTEGGSVPTDEDAEDFSGRVNGVNIFTAQTATLYPDQNAYRMRFWFDDGRAARPADKLYILPMLVRASTLGTRLNLTGSDDRYETLGRLAFMEVEFADAPHSDHMVDPYRTDRNYDPLKRSTFWQKWVARNKFGRTRALIRRHTGYAGQRLSEMQRQTYVVDRVSEAMDKLTMSCRDILSLTEFRRAQVPPPSPGKLALAMTDSDTTLYLVGDQVAEYPASGTLRVGDELMTYTAITYDGGEDQTDVTGLTRGTDGSSADDHDVNEGVQICRRYTNTRVAPLLEELIIDDARVPAQLVDLAKIYSEDDASLSAYTLTTLISEPTGVSRLVGEIAEQCSFYIWWNERRQIVDMQAIKPLSGVTARLTQERDIVGGSLRVEERPKERLTTLSIYYGPRDFAGDLGKAVNFKNQLVVSNSTVTSDDLYGKLPQTREIFSRWLETEAQANQTGSRLSVRYQDIPVAVTFRIDAKDRALWVGDFLTISHDYLVDARGNRLASRRWLIIEAEEVEAGHSQQITALDITLDGLIYTITENGIGNYTEDLFGEGNAFITDNFGLNPDGTQGATIG